MARVTDPAAIRMILNQDRPWSAYALGDLAPGFFEKCVWCRAEGGALALVYLGFQVPVLIALGHDQSWPDAWSEAQEFLGAGREVYVAVRPTVMEHLRQHHAVTHEKAMIRMVLSDEERQTGSARAWGVPGRRILGCLIRGDHSAALGRLYATGEPVGEAPEFFQEEMLGDGAYFGIWEENELVAVAGTHLVSPAENVAAIGNIFTRPDRRGRGLGTLVTRAVVGNLRDRKIGAIVLNVRSTNMSARRIYERLGFRTHCPYFEAVVRL